MLSPEKNFKPLSDKELETTYLAEIRALERIIKSSDFTSILGHFQNYPVFLASQRQSPLPLDAIPATARGGKIVEVNNTSSKIVQLFGTAHFAACSVLLEEAQIHLSRLQSGSLVNEMKQSLAQTLAAGAQASQSLMQRLIAMDAVRTFQILRIAGLLHRPCEEMFQLGLGAAGGTKDIFSVHTEPSIYILPGAEGQIVGFNYEEKHAADTIISDLDPRHTALYDKFSRDENLSVTGYISDTTAMLEVLQSRDIRKRNLITMLRIEPAMIPDCQDLLLKLYPVLDEDCDLVLSIGAGDSPAAYKQRIDVVAEMFDELERAELNPVLFRLHLGGNIMQQASSLQFGNAATSSYEILYCKIDKEKLKKGHCRPII